MIATAFNRTWQQLLHPKFRSVFLTALIAAGITLVALMALLNSYWPESYTFGWEWLGQYSSSIMAGGFWAVATVGSYLLFPGVVTMVMGLLTDKIASAVGEEYYPNHPGTRQLPVGDVIVSAAKLTLIMVLVNLLAILPYIILMFLTAGTGTLLLFVILNGFLLGREYFEMVALRHMDPRSAKHFRVEHSGKIFLAGTIIAAMFLVPFLNILAPITGAAVMTHIFHHLGGPQHSK
ncbi:MAG: EI24 domain-containing protein [Kordiimonadaceae bacterium]|nr:EI24 domain-containing protein [Kordiimonadaceae bacterium]